MISFYYALVLSIVMFAFNSVAEHCYDNTVVIQDGSFHASGVLFTREDNTFVWTVAHVADHYMRDNGTFRDVLIKQSDKLVRARILRCGDCYITHDLALLQVVEDGLKGDAQFYRAFNEVKLGQRIIHCGTPYNIILNSRLIFYGHISHVGRIFSTPSLLGPREVDQCNIVAYPGCSGGPVFDIETGNILGLMSLGGSPGLTAMVPTRVIYKWAKEHDCLWAFDSEIPLPENIVPWRCDVLARIIKNRNTVEIDKRWGKKPLPTPTPKPVPTPWPPSPFEPGDFGMRGE